MHAALAFSGGKDSWACLWLLADAGALAETTVLWVNTGKNYPELLANIELARNMCPHFVEVKSDRAAQNRECGIPSDVVPIQWTRMGQIFSGPKPVTIQSYLDCCYQNMAAPLMAQCRALGVTHLIRGQRNDEPHKSPARTGTVVDGITFIQPIENWSSQEVLAFVGAHMELPEHWVLKHTSMDCYDCTAYRAESQQRIAYTAAHHPELYKEYAARAAALNDALDRALEV